MARGNDNVVPVHCVQGCILRLFSLSALEHDCKNNHGRPSGRCLGLGLVSMFIQVALGLR